MKKIINLSAKSLLLSFFILGMSITSFSKTIIDGDIKNKKTFVNSDSKKELNVFSHGRSGELLFNGQWLNSEELVSLLKPLINKEIELVNIFGCEFAKGEKGLNAVNHLKEKLGVAISASTNITGVDGDWILEIGSVSNSPSFPNYEYNLQDTDGDLVDDVSDLDDDNDGILDVNESASKALKTYDVLKGDPDGLVTGDVVIMPDAINYNGTIYDVLVTFEEVVLNPGDNLTIVDDSNAEKRFRLNASVDSDNVADPYVVYSISIVEQNSADTDFVGVPVTLPYVYIDLGDIDSSGQDFEELVGYETASGASEYFVGDNISAATHDNGGPTGYTLYSAGKGTGTVSSTVTDNHLIAYYDTYSSETFSFGLSGDVNGLNRLIFNSIAIDYDTDNDGVVNRLDSDSDNDGCPDSIESGGVDANKDGIIDGTGSSIFFPGIVLGTSGGYNGVTGKETVANEIFVDATALVDQNVSSGASATFTITSAEEKSTTTYSGSTPDYSGSVGSTSDLEYQWLENGQPLTDGGVYSGATTDELTISNVDGLDGNIYTLAVTSANTLCPVENSAALTVGTLPVELLSFNVSLHESDAQLKWTTANEVNFAGFEIEKSFKSTNEFQTIGKIASLDNDYEFLDENIAKGNSYYRLKMIDLDGTYEYSKIVAINSENDFVENAVFPNPTYNKEFRIKNISEIDNYEILDLKGNKVLSTLNTTSKYHIFKVSEVGTFVLKYNDISQKIVVLD